MSVFLLSTNFCVLYAIMQLDVTKLLLQTSLALVPRQHIELCTKSALLWLQSDHYTEIRNTQRKFYLKARFPKVIGAIDCTHIKLSKSPGGDNAEIFRNRKGFYAINTQVICNKDMVITDVVARWPEGRYGDGVLVGDGGYACKNYMMTPLENCNSPAENLYNESQIRTRNVIERLFGIWKRRFLVMALGLHVNVNNAFPIIMVTAVLHNIARRAAEDIPPDDNDLVLPAPWDILLAQDNMGGGHPPINPNPRTRQNPNHRERNSLIDIYFQRLAV